jgi:phosphoribosyl 1,2-cyclic phosphodiesterase
MGMRFQILGSGSAGNCALLLTDHARILVDAGFSARRLNQLIREAGSDLSQIDAVFITHEHSDHVAGIEGLKRYPHIELFANVGTARAVQNKLEHRPRWRVFETGTRFTFRDLEIESFHIPHDAQEPVGYTFTHGHGPSPDQGPGHKSDPLSSPLPPPPPVQRRIAWLSDMGHVPDHIRERIREADAVVMESNHCPRLLEADHRRPWSTKQRIAGRHGHLSNELACELLASVASPRWQHIVLTHLSRDCNTLDAVERTFAALRARLTCQFAIVPPGGGTALVELR